MRQHTDHIIDAIDHHPLCDKKANDLFRRQRQLIVGRQHAGCPRKVKTRRFEGTLTRIALAGVAVAKVQTSTTLIGP